MWHIRGTLAGMDLSRLHVIEHTPDQSVVLPTVASLIVPGLGQALLGQYLKALWVFAFCAPLAMACGLGNLLAAADAHSVASSLRQHAVGRNHTSNWLFFAVWIGRLVRLARHLQR